MDKQDKEKFLYEAFEKFLGAVSQANNPQHNELEEMMHQPSLAQVAEFHNERVRAEKKLNDFIRQNDAFYALLKDPNISDILINGYKDVFLEIGGVLQKADITFESENFLWQLMEKIADASGHYIDPARPMIDTKLPDGSRVNFVANPIAIDGVSISIRKFSDRLLTMSSLCETGQMTPNMAEFLRICARSRINTVIVGGTGAGKTTMLNAVSQHIDENERVVTIEDSAELKIPVKNKVRLEANKYQISSKSEQKIVTIRDCVLNALRMRPDRIIIGEIRGGEAFDLIQAMNTGHEGSMTTMHANSPRDMLLRLESMVNVVMPSMSSLSIKQRISSAIELIVMVSRSADGRRRVTHITEVLGIEGSTVLCQDLFSFNEKGRDEEGNVLGNFESSNIMPRFADKCFRHGFKQQMWDIFNAKV